MDLLKIMFSHKTNENNLHSILVPRIWVHFSKWTNSKNINCHQIKIQITMMITRGIAI